jgi:hypothetical protein
MIEPSLRLGALQLIAQLNRDILDARTPQADSHNLPRSSTSIDDFVTRTEGLISKLEWFLVPCVASSPTDANTAFAIIRQLNVGLVNSQESEYASIEVYNDVESIMLERVPVDRGSFKEGDRVYITITPAAK